MAEIILREECNNVLGSVTDLCKRFLGRLTRDPRLLGDMEGGREAGGEGAVDKSLLRTVFPGWVRGPT